MAVSLHWTNIPTIKDASWKTFNHVLTVTERGLKQVVLIPCLWKDTAPQVAEKLRHLGSPSSIVSDRDTKFTSVFWKSMCDIMEIKMQMTSPLHPQANGAGERTNQTMKHVLWTREEASEAASTNWLLRLDFVEIAINNAPIADTELSPFYLNLRYHLLRHPPTWMRSF